MTRGPYLQLATPESVVVVWRTNGEIAPDVRIGGSPEALRSAPDQAVTARLAADVAAAGAEPFGTVPLLYDEPRGHASERGEREPSTPAGTRQYEVRIGGLSPGQRCFYAVYDGPKRLAGGDAEHFFRTSPEPGSAADVRLWVVGDSGTGGRDQRMVFEAMSRFAADTGRRPDAFVHVGDMAYGDGADAEFQENFFDVYQPTLRHTVCWPAMGNHEGHTSRGLSQFGPYYDAYVLPTAAEAGGVASGTEAYYSFDLGRAHFICLDSHDLDRSSAGAMAQWLAMDLERVDADWLIAFWHHPPYTKGSHDSDRELQLIEMRTYIMPLLEEAGVDLVLAGHSHIYERSMLIDGAYATPTVAEGVVLDDGDGRPEGDGPYRKSAGLRPHNGTLAIVAGHGGAGVSRKGTMPIMREIIVENGSLVVDLHGDTLTGVMIDRRGEARDRFQLVKRGEVTHRPVANPWTPPHDPESITETPIVWDASHVDAPPPDWTVARGEPAAWRVKQREGTPFFQAEVRSGEGEFCATYQPFDGALSELEAWIEVTGGAGGLVLGWRGPEDYYAFEFDAAARTARFVRVLDGRRRVISERPIDLDPGKPIKVELEPVEKIIEVQLNDAIEYTIQLDHRLPRGRFGVEARGAEVNLAGVMLERAR